MTGVTCVVLCGALLCCFVFIEVLCYVTSYCIVFCLVAPSVVFFVERVCCGGNQEVSQDLSGLEWMIVPKHDLSIDLDCFLYRRRIVQGKLRSVGGGGGGREGSDQAYSQLAVDDDDNFDPDAPLLIPPTDNVPTDQLT